MRLFKRGIISFMLIVIVLTACKKKEKESSSEEISLPTGMEVLTNQPTQTVTPTPTKTGVPTKPPSPTQTPSPTIKVIPEKTVFTFEVQPINIPQDMEVPHMSKEEFPKLDGSTANIPLGEALYCYITNATKEEAKKDLKFYKTPDAYKNLMYEQSDILIVYEPPQSILEDMHKYNYELEFKPLGRDALVFLGNETNPVSNLTKEQIMNIYTGAVTNWKELGGKENEILAFQRPESSGSQTLMEKLAVPSDKIMRGPTVKSIEEMSGLVDAIAQYNNKSNAIGYSVYYYANYMYQQPGLKFFSIDGISPTDETIQSGEYPYVNDFYVVIRKNEPKDSKARLLYEWLTSIEAQKLVAGAGYVPVVNVEQQKLDLPIDTIEPKPISIKEDEYVVIHNSNAQQEPLGDVLLNRYVKEVLIFSGKRVLIDANLLCKKTDWLILQSIRPQFGLPDEGSHYQYELYDLSSTKYITDRKYDRLYQLNNDIYIARVDAEESILSFLFSNKKHLDFQEKNNQYYDYAVSKNRLFVSNNHEISLYDNQGELIKTIPISNEGHLSKVEGVELSNYVQFRYQQNNSYFLYLISEQGDIIKADTFLNKTKWKSQAGIISDVIYDEKGNIWTAIYVDGNLLVVSLAGKVQFQFKAMVESSGLMFYPGYIRLYNIESDKPYYYDWDGKEIGGKVGEEFGFLNFNLIVCRQNGFTMYNQYQKEHYDIKVKNYNRDQFYGMEGYMIPNLVSFEAEGKNGEVKEYTYYGDKLLLNKRAFAIRELKDYIVIGSDNYSYVFTKTGKKVYESEKGERIRDLILGEQLYVYVEQGNYRGIKDMNGNFLYRTYSPNLDD
ncbi:substrate-binding domain-containing protein [Lachnoclostridium phytofermentans]|uniref:ABC-type phosphate transport system periplasmic component-like protein n=1 Tax=Lachnoclostridium phytofermentans (strain ATCC 700394 / DSM 18823 / ISDg) TaxID=357809 RepID=A9KMK3_LACP7|nr:substrate-binding domain-containing protein [Lachnoclostridium phytofermentans]ABX41448.1 ABC-type phosphate transport system periplasmic component-like protein [Lachnoclostridium phytofermentans ISDg]